MNKMDKLILGSLILFSSFLTPFRNSIIWAKTVTDAPTASPVGVMELASLGDLVFAITEDFLYMSQDCGETWILLTIGLNAGLLYSIDTDSGNLYLGTDNGVVVSEDLGDSFSWSFEWGWDASYDVDFQDGYGWDAIVSWGSRSGANRKIPGGTWELRSGIIPNNLNTAYAVVADSVDPLNIAYAAGQGYYGFGYFRTMDGGEHWLEIDDMVIFTTKLDGVSFAFANNPNSIEDARFSNDNGDTWSSLGLKATAFVKDDTANLVFAADNTGDVYTGEPQNWQLYGAFSQPIQSLVLCGDSLLAASERGDVLKVSEFKFRFNLPLVLR